MGFPGYAGWTVTLDPTEVASNRAPLELNDPQSGITIGDASGAGIDWGTASVTEYLAQQGTYGSTVADFVIPNRTITIPLGLGMSTHGGVDMETALANLRQKVALFQRENGWLKRQRAGGQALYAEIVDAQLTVPDQWGETAGLEPGVSLVLTALPDFFGDEITLDTIYCTGFCDAVLQQNSAPAVIEGDYPARTRMLVMTSLAPQYGAMWGVRSRHYVGSGGLLQGQGLAYGATNMLAIGGSSHVSLSGAYGGQAVQSVALTAGTPLDFAELSGGHIGTYEVWARLSYTGTTYPSPTLQFQWLAGVSGNPLTLNTPVTVPDASFGIADLGTIRIDPSPVSQISWRGFLQVTAGVNGQQVAVDEIWLQPLDESAGRTLPGNTMKVITDVIPTEVRTEGVFPPFNKLATIGDLLRLPPSGMEQRPVEMFVKPTEGFLPTIVGSSPGDAGIDTFTVQVAYRPCYMFRP